MACSVASCARGLGRSAEQGPIPRLVVGPGTRAHGSQLLVWRDEV